MVITVSDTGIGIEPLRQKYLFNMFHELVDCGNILKVKDQNIGFGLTSAKDIVNAIDGGIKLLYSDVDSSDHLNSNLIK